MINNISKTTLSKRTKTKRNLEIIETINLAKKNNLLDLAKKLSAPRSQYKNINLDELEKAKGDKILVIGKILGSGNISRKIGIAALGFSESARESLNKAGCELKSIRTAIEKNPKMEGVTII
jgi:large subunit ribosomal protein L18e